MHTMLTVGDLEARCRTSGRLSTGTDSSCSRVAHTVHKENKVHNSVRVGTCRGVLYLAHLPPLMFQWYVDGTRVSLLLCVCTAYCRSPHQHSAQHA